MAGSPSARPTTSCSTHSVARSAVPTCSTTRASPAARGGWSTATRSPEIEKTTAKESRAHWLDRLESAGVPSGPINTYPEALSDPHTLARGMVVDLVHPGAGPIKALGVPVHLSETPGAVDGPAPLIGQHNDEILAELGYDAAARQRLRDAGVV